MTRYLEAMAIAVWLVIGFAALTAVIAFELDRLRTADAIRRNNAKWIEKEVETIAHSLRVSEPRKLRRRHVRLVQPDGSSTPMDRLYRGEVAEQTRTHAI